MPPWDRIFLYGATCEQTFVSAHELGHIIGLNHAQALEGPTVRDYGDSSDVMGNGLLPINGPHRAQLGWIPFAQIIPAEAPTTSTLSPLGEDESRFPQLLVLEHNDPGKAIYVSLRTAAGLDANLPVSLDNGISIHEFVQECPTSLPMPKTLLLGTLHQGEEFSVEQAGVSLHYLSSNLDGAVLEISPL